MIGIHNPIQYINLPCALMQNQKKKKKNNNKNKIVEYIHKGILLHISIFYVYNKLVT